GFKISTVIAGLGIGGIAVALAAQAILGDLFSYFSILFDRPFEVGDFIILDDYLGTIEHIGIKTTRVRSLGGEQLVFSNADLTNSRLRNYKRMAKRRVVFKLGVTYQTTLEQVKEIPTIIKNIIQNITDTVFDRAHFSSYGDFSLVFETVYYVLSRDYNKYMNIQQEINFAIKEEFEKRGIEFAYPTQTLFLEKT
ncbi:MAG: mechanosensitive ion channel family protein, partial [candidate division Zixibacteria bacterium]|nr:mechanosensitive ion channel family protein [candidate division Zixibacteria bacterium]